MDDVTEDVICTRCAVSTLKNMERLLFFRAAGCVSFCFDDAKSILLEIASCESLMNNDEASAT